MNGISQDEKGAYHWHYEYKVLKRFGILFTLLKVMGLALLITTAIIGVIFVASDGLAAFYDVLQVFVMLAGILFVMTILSYLIWSLINGGEYGVEFHMDEVGIAHVQVPKQAQKNKKMGCLIAVIGIFFDSYSTAGSGLLATRTTSYSKFKTANKVVGLRRQNTIKIRDGLDHNEIYTTAEDYQFVFDYIAQHCPNAQIYEK